MFRVFLDHIFGGKLITNEDISEKTVKYLQSFQNKKDIEKEFVKYISKSIVSMDHKILFDIIKILMTKPKLDLFALELIGPLFIVFSPSWNDLLSISHIFCKCSKNSDNFREWIKINKSILSLEIPVYKFIYNNYNKWIQQNIIPYREINIYIPKNNTQNLARRLLTVIKYSC